MELILLDTNVWRSTALLQGMLGRTLISYIQLSGKRILLPETVEREVIEIVSCHLTSLCEEIDARARELSRYNAPHLGMAKKPTAKKRMREPFFENFYPLPEPTRVRQAVGERIDEMLPLIKKRPLTLRQVRGALQMAVRHDPPSSSRREEFRDCLIWQAAMQSAPGDIIHFVTSDRAFFEGQDPKGTLAQPLQKMAEAEGVKVLIYSALEDYLTSTLHGSVALRESKYTRQLRRWIDRHAAGKLQEVLAGTCVFVSAEYVPVPSFRAKTVTVQFHLSWKVSGRPPGAGDQAIRGAGITVRGTASFTKSEGRLLRGELAEAATHTVDQTGNIAELPVTLYVGR